MSAVFSVDQVDLDHVMCAGGHQGSGSEVSSMARWVGHRGSVCDLSS